MHQQTSAMLQEPVARPMFYGGSAVGRQRNSAGMGRIAQLQERGMGWPVSNYSRDEFFPPKEFEFIDLRAQDDEKYIDLAAKFYMDTFNKAGLAAGIGTPWTLDHAQAQLKKRLKQPGVAFLLLSLTNNSRPVAGFFTELLPTVHGLKATELDVIVDEDMRRCGLGARVTLYGYNALVALCHDHFTLPITAFSGETYREGYQQQFWKKTGFAKFPLSTANIDLRNVPDSTHGFSIVNLTRDRIGTLVELLTRDSLDSSQHREMQPSWNAEQATDYVCALEEYLGIVQGNSPIISYIATNAASEAVGVLIAHSTIRRGGEVVLSAPFCAIDENLTGNCNTSGLLIKGLFHRAAQDALKDARKFGLREMQENVAGIDFGDCNTVFFTERKALDDGLDPKFYGICVNDRGMGRGTMAALQAYLHKECSKSGIRVHVRDPKLSNNLPKLIQPHYSL